MKYEKALRKIIARVGADIEIRTEVRDAHAQRWFEYAGRHVSWCEDKQTGEANLFHVRRVQDIPDSTTDYFPGFFCDNVTQLLDSVCPGPPKFPVGTLVRGKNNKRTQRHGFAGHCGLIQESGTYCSVYWDNATTGRYISERDLELVAACTEPVTT